jgi:ferredoxin
MRVVVDKMVCEANGVCENIVPEVFQLDDEDELHILQPEVPPELEDKVRDAVDRCPKLALNIPEES